MKTNKMMRKMVKGNEGGFALIWAYMVCAFFASLIITMYSINLWQMKHDNINLGADTQAFYLAETGVDEMYNYIEDNISSITSTVSISGNLGTGLTYTASYDPITKLLSASGTVSLGSASITKNLSTKVVIGAPYDVPPGVQAGISSATQVVFSGKITVDGRNHTSTGALSNAAPGIAGVTYYSPSDLQDNAPSVVDSNVLIGGYSAAPANPADPTTLNEVTGNTNLTTPEAVFGLSSGALDAFKTTVPPSIRVNGIVYLDNTAGTTSLTAVMGTGLQVGVGVLIIDSPSAAVTVSGTLKGILITNGPVNFAAGAKVIGAHVIVSSNAYQSVALTGPATGTAAQILYCDTCIQNVYNSSLYTTTATMRNWAQIRSNSVNPLANTLTGTVSAGNGIE